MSSANAIAQLQNQGHRITTARRVLLEIFDASRRPLNAQDINQALTRQGVKVNTSTIYRELQFLQKQGLVNPLQLSTNQLYYESAQLPHHHHLVCDSCGSIDPVECHEVESPLRRLETRVNQTGFTITNHTLEFYGTCAGCR